MDWEVIKNKNKILAFLKALWFPKKLAITHCQREDGFNLRGNNQTDKTTVQVALHTNVVFAHVLVDLGVPNLPKNPRYTKEDLHRLRTSLWPSIKTGELQTVKLSCLHSWERDCSTRFIDPLIWEQRGCKTWLDSQKLESNVQQKL